MPEPAIDDGLIDPSEISGVGKIILRIELCKAGQLSVLSTLYLFADHEHVIRCTVIRAKIYIFRDASTELRKDHQRDIICPTYSLKILHKGRDCVGGVGEEAAVNIVLEHMRVKGIVSV